MHSCSRSRSARPRATPRSPISCGCRSTSRAGAPDGAADRPVPAEVASDAVGLAEGDPLFTFYRLSGRRPDGAALSETPGAGRAGEVAARQRELYARLAAARAAHEADQEAQTTSAERAEQPRRHAGPRGGALLR
jgi:hypothetical protein